MLADAAKTTTHLFGRSGPTMQISAPGRLVQQRFAFRRCQLQLSMPNFLGTSDRMFSHLLRSFVRFFQECVNKVLLTSSSLHEKVNHFTLRKAELFCGAKVSNLNVGCQQHIQSEMHTQVASRLSTQASSLCKHATYILYHNIYLAECADNMLIMNT